MSDWKETCKTVASHMMVASAVILFTATAIGALVSTLDDESDKEKDDDGETEK